MLSRPTTRRAWTFIELLVVVAILTLLIGILVPVLRQARNAARDTGCLANQRALLTAVALYTLEHDEVYPLLPTDRPRIAADCGRAWTPEVDPDGDLVAPLFEARGFADFMNPYVDPPATLKPAFDDRGRRRTFAVNGRVVPQMDFRPGSVFQCPRSIAKGNTLGNGDEIDAPVSYVYSQSFYYAPQTINRVQTFLDTIFDFPRGQLGCPSPQRASSVRFPAAKVLLGDEFGYHSDPLALRTWFDNELDDTQFNLGFPDGHARRVRWGELDETRVESLIFPGERLRNPHFTADGIRGFDL